MTNNTLLLNRAQVLDILPFGRKGLENLIKSGEIGYKKVGNRYYFLRSDIEQWATNLNHHIDYTKGATPTIPTTRSMSKDGAYSLEKLATQMTLSKPKHLQITA
jgi:hypothetical protein